MTLSTDPVDPGRLGMSPARLDHAASLMQRQYDDDSSPMLVAVVARHGQVVFSHAIGDRRPGGPPLSVDDIFPLASQTKPMVAATLMCLVERGLVGLNESATVHVPELEAGGDAAVMVHHLLTHTSGWNEDDVTARMDERLDQIGAAWTGEPDLLSQILLLPGFEVPRRTRAGELMQYCNFNYSLLGEIIRRATGTTLDEAMRQYLFEPIGMTNSAVIVPEDMQCQVIERPPGIPFGPDHADSPISFNDPLWAACDDGAGGVHASAIDCVRFGQMILDGGAVGDRRVLSRDAVRVMTTNQIPGVGAEVLGLRRDEACWGYGFGITSDAPWMRFSGGTVNAGSSRHGGMGGINVWIDPTTGIVGAYFEMVTEWSDEKGPVSWAAHRFEDTVTAAVLD